MRKIILVVLCLLIVWAVSGVNAEYQVVLHCADVHSVGYPTIEGVRYLDTLLRKQTHGKIGIKIYPQSSLGSEKSVLDMVKLGALDMGRISLTQVAEVDNEMGVLMLPYLFADDRHKWSVLNGPIGAKLLRGLSRVGIIGLCFQEAGYRSFYNSKHPIYKPEDLKGLKIRVQPSRIMVKMVELFGASAVPIDYEEVYSALSAKVIDGAENNIPSYFTSGHYRVAKYFSMDLHTSIPEILIISKKSWSRLTEKERQTLTETAAESVAYQRKRWISFEAECKRQLEAAGCQLNYVDLEAFKTAMNPFYRNYRKQYRQLIGEIEKIK